MDALRQSIEQVNKPLAKADAPRAAAESLTIRIGQRRAVASPRARVEDRDRPTRGQMAARAAPGGPGTARGLPQGLPLGGDWRAGRSDGCPREERRQVRRDGAVQDGLLRLAAMIGRGRRTWAGHGSASAPSSPATRSRSSKPSRPRTLGQCPTTWSGWSPAIFNPAPRAGTSPYWTISGVQLKTSGVPGWTVTRSHRVAVLPNVPRRVRFGTPA
jgi:hypothetical protein